MTDSEPLAPYDAVVLLSFGGPEKPDDVVPFLQNVTRGKGIPAVRLVEVGQHYFDFGGKSPINDQNRALLAALRERLDALGSRIPLVWGNRNWDPYLVDTLRAVRDDGARRVLVLTTSAYSSYSSCRQYREDIAAAVAELRPSTGGGPVVQVDQVPRYFGLDGFVTANADGLLAALDRLESWPDRVIFVTHSLPTAMAETSGPPGTAAVAGYVAQHQAVIERVSAMVRERTGRAVETELAFCSRSGPPSQPWLEPDVNDRLEELAAAGSTTVVLAPIGFVSDHMEVAFDLDVQARQTCERLGIRMERAATAGTHPEFVDGLVQLLAQRAAQARGEEPVHDALPGQSPICAAGCCPNLRGERPAACGSD